MSSKFKSIMKNVVIALFTILSLAFATIMLAEVFMTMGVAFPTAMAFGAVMTLVVVPTIRAYKLSQKKVIAEGMDKLERRMMADAQARNAR